MFPKAKVEMAKASLGDWHRTGWTVGFNMNLTGQTGSVLTWNPLLYYIAWMTSCSKRGKLLHLNLYS